MSRRFRLPKDRIVALGADWGLLLLLSYCIYFLINHWYRTLVLVRPSYQVPFPEYAYVLTLATTFLIAVLWENLGTSIGWKGVGLEHVDLAKRHLGLRQRLAHAFADLAAWPLTVLGAVLVSLPFVALGALLSGIASGTGLTLIPAVPFWPVGGWLATLGLTIVLFVVLATLAAACWWGARALWRWLWPGGKGERPWAERTTQTQVCRAREVEQSGPPRRWWRTGWGLMTLLLAILTVYVGALTTQINIGTLIRRAPTTATYWAKLARPDFAYFLASEPDLNDTMLNATVVSVFMALMATLLGFVFAFPLSFLGARNMVTRNRWGWGVYTLTRGFFNIGRSIEPFVMAVFFAVWIGYGPFAGALALFVHTVAALGKLFSEQVEAIDPGPVEAITAGGGRRAQILRYGVIPQIVPSFLAFTLYRWDINVRMSTVIGIVAGCGIGRFFNYFKSELRWQQVGAVLVVIAVVVLTMDYVSGRVRERIT